MNHDCENCNHYNFLIHHEAGVFYQCFLGNKLWEECNDFDEVKEVKKMTDNERFVYIEHKGADYILEEPKWHLDFIEMLGDCLDSEEIVNRLNKLYNENEQLKQELKVYRKVANCSNCNYHNYDWFDDGDEFEVCDKGNDVTEGICEEWREL